MSALKVERLFYSLSSEEREAFRVSLSSRQSALLRLFDELEELSRNQGSLARAKRRLVQTLYDAPFAKATDVRFRDDCRKLSERLEDFLAERQSVQEVESNSLSKHRFLLEALLERGLWSDFDAHYRKARAASLAACDYATLLAIDDLRLRQLWESRTHKPEALSQLLADIEETEAHLKSHFATTRARLASIRATARHYLRLQPPNAPRASSNYVDFSNAQTPLSQYYEKKSRAFERALQADVGEARDALNIILRLPNQSPAIRNEQLAAMGNLGLAYMLNGDYRSALRYYRKAFEFSESHQLAFSASLAFNYASVLMKLARYKDAATLFQAKWELFAKGEMVRHRAEAMRCFCHIFLGEANVANALLPRSLAPYPLAVQNYFHFAKIAIRVAEANLFDAEREIQNLHKRFHRNKQKARFEAERKLVSLYQKFIRARQEPPDDSNLVLVEKLNDELASFLNAHQEQRDTLPVAWLEMRLNELSGLTASDTSRHKRRVQPVDLPRQARRP